MLAWFRTCSKIESEELRSIKSFYEISRNLFVDNDFAVWL